ncbi:MAG: EamA family transporter [Canibacter sp.]
MIQEASRQGKPRRSAPQHVPIQYALGALILVFIGSIGVQSSSALSIGLFSSLGPVGTSGGRMIVAAIILLIVFRPQIFGRSRAEWIGIAAYGVSIAMMNLFLYLSIDRIPLGIATTIDFLGPCVVVLLSSRRAREWILAIFALAGVSLITGFGGNINFWGIFFAVCAGTFFGLYTYIAPKIGSSQGGVKDLALSVTIAALILAPAGVPTLISAAKIEWLTLVIIAILGTAVPFFVDTLAGKISSAGLIGIFFAFDPTLGTIVGAVFLDQALTTTAVIGIVLVIVAGAGIVWSASRHVPEADFPDATEVIR